MVSCQRKKQYVIEIVLEITAPSEAAVENVKGAVLHELGHTFMQLNPTIEEILPLSLVGIDSFKIRERSWLTADYAVNSEFAAGERL